MREYPGTYYRSTDDEIRDFVQNAIASGQTTFTDINGIRLIVNPKHIKRRMAWTTYADQLIWTFDMVNFKRGVLHRRRTYVNQVPVLRRLAKRKLREFKQLDLLDFKAIIRWLLEVAPATHCTWAWPAIMGKRVAKALEASHVRRGNEFLNPAKAPALPPLAFQQADELIRTACVTLSSSALECLTVGWIQEARQWVKDNG